MYRISLPSLQAFEKVAALGSQRAAAEALGVTQTAVSHAVRGLEERLGFRLFAREGRRLVLTEKGALLAGRLGTAFADIERAVGAVRGNELPPTVSVTPAFAAAWLAPRLARRAAEGASIDLRMLTTRSVTPLGVPGGADISIRYAREAEGELLGEEVFIAVHSKNYAPEADGSAGPLIETAWERAPGFAPRWADWFAADPAEEISGRPIITFTDEHETIQAALAGAGMALASSILVSDLLERGLLVRWRPDLALEGLRYWMLEAEDAPAAPRREALKAWLREEFGTKALTSSRMHDTKRLELRERGMTTDKERLIRDYVAAYNRFDVDGMLAQLHDDIRFEHASDGVVALAVTGKDAFADLARQAADAFAEREQVITELTIDGDEAVAVIDYRALPKGGDELRGKGRSLFTFRDGRIAVLRDEA